MTSQFMLPNFGGELPLGYIFEFDPTGITGAPDLSTAEKVHDYFGYGVWKDYGSGRVTIGVSNTHAISTEGGEENHTLTVGELARHSHIEVFQTGDGNANPAVVTSISGINSGAYNKNEYTTGKSYMSTLYQGMDRPHNNMQPYKTVYRWRRIA